MANVSFRQNHFKQQFKANLIKVLKLKSDKIAERQFHVAIKVLKNKKKKDP